MIPVGDDGMTSNYPQIVEDQFLSFSHILFISGFSAGPISGGDACEGLVEFAADFSLGFAGDPRSLRRNSP